MRKYEPCLRGRPVFAFDFSPRGEYNLSCAAALTDPTHTDRTQATLDQTLNIINEAAGRFLFLMPLPPLARRLTSRFTQQ